MYGLKSSSSHICDHSRAPRRTSALITMTQRFAVVGGKMTRPLGFVLALFIVGSVSPTKAGGNTNVKCAPNEDRVWVYESLDDFNVAAKLKCGDPVQIVGRVKGYVKIETANGTDGYVLDSALPKSALPPEPEEKPNTVEAASLAFAARRAAKSSANSANPAPSASSTSAVASSAPVTVASKPAPAAATGSRTSTASTRGDHDSLCTCTGSQCLKPTCDRADSRACSCYRPGASSEFRSSCERRQHTANTVAASASRTESCRQVQ